MEELNEQAQSSLQQVCYQRKIATEMSIDWLTSEYLLDWNRWG